MTPETLTQKVKDYFALGYPPSEIDRRLKLQPGVAKDIIVAEWAAEKARQELKAKRGGKSWLE